MLAGPAATHGHARRGARAVRAGALSSGRVTRPQSGGVSLKLQLEGGL